eukprot:7503342-Ditylum_brightwellii.AAC.1
MSMAARFGINLSPPIPQDAALAEDWEPNGLRTTSQFSEEEAAAFLALICFRSHRDMAPLLTVLLASEKEVVMRFS